MGTLVCRIELDKQQGITVTVENEDGKITQTIVMDGTSIITTVKGEKETSKITQKDASITINVKDFTVAATGKITVSSDDYTKFTTKKTFSITSKEDTSITSETKNIVMKAEKADITADSKKFAATGKTEATMTGGKGVFKGTASEATVDGPKVGVTAKTACEISGATSKLSGKTKVDVESQVSANLVGKATKIGGMQITLG